MSLLDAFVVVSRPIKEVFSVDSTAVVLKSMVNPGVQLVIPPETFDERTKLTLEVGSIIIRYKDFNSEGKCLKLS